jgi:hypothetical protein
MPLEAGAVRLRAVFRDEYVNILFNLFKNIKVLETTQIGSILKKLLKNIST